MRTHRWGRIEFIPGPNRGTYPHCHSLYIDDEVRAVIDPASDERRMKALGAGGMDVVINSHYHEDHFLYNYLFPRADLYVPREDAPCFRSLDRLLEYYGVLGTADEARWRTYMLDVFHYRERVPAREFTDGETLSFGATTVEVVHTPGHTPGHSCLYMREERVLFLADLDLTAFGPWYADASSDLDRIVASIERIRSIPARVFVTAHGEGPVQGDVGKKIDAFLAVIDRREADLLEYLREPRTLEEIVGRWIVYKKRREPAVFYEFGERGTMTKHLARLMRRGAVALHEGRYRRT